LHARLGKVDSTYVDTIADHQQRDHARSSKRDPIVPRIMEQPVQEAPVNVPIAFAYVSSPTRPCDTENLGPHEMHH
jgi:hypothetical protein